MLLYFFCTPCTILIINKKITPELIFIRIILTKQQRQPLFTLPHLSSCVRAHTPTYASRIPRSFSNRPPEPINLQRQVSDTGPPGNKRSNIGRAIMTILSLDNVCSSSWPRRHQKPSVWIQVQSHRILVSPGRKSRSPCVVASVDSSCCLILFLVVGSLISWWHGWSRLTRHTIDTRLHRLSNRQTHIIQSFSHQLLLWTPAPGVWTIPATLHPGRHASRIVGH